MLSRLLSSMLLLAVAGPPAHARSPPTTAATLDHVAIHVRDADRSTAFYKELFGLRQVAAPVPFARWLAFGNGTMLHIVAGRNTPVANPSWDHFAFSCEDMDEMIARLDAKRINWADIAGRPTPQVRADGVKQIFIQDPDDYWIEINDALKKRGGYQ